MPPSQSLLFSDAVVLATPTVFGERRGLRDHGHPAAFCSQRARAGRQYQRRRSHRRCLSVEPFCVPVRFLLWAARRTGGFIKGPGAVTLSNLARDCVMKTVMSNDWRAPSMAAAGCLLGLALMMAATPAAAQGTPEQRAACEQDAYRFCQQYIPDENRTASCLRRHSVSLSPACRKLFSGGRRSRGRH